MTARTPAPAPDYVGYPEIRRKIRRLLAERPGEDGRAVPSCPEWTVADLLAHLVEVAGRVLLRLGAAVPPPGEGTGHDVAALLDRWDELGAELDSLLAEAGGGRGEVMVMDAFTHELDLRVALGVPAPERHVAFAGSFDVLVRGLSGSIRELGLPALRILAGDGEWVAGSGVVAAEVSGPPGELYRSLAGRRAPGQIAALTWSSDPAPWLPAFAWGPFEPPAEPVE